MSFSKSSKKTAFFNANHLMLTNIWKNYFVTRLQRTFLLLKLSKGWSHYFHKWHVQYRLFRAFFLEKKLIMLRVFDKYLRSACMVYGFKPWIKVEPMCISGSNNRNNPINIVKSEKLFSQWEGLTPKNPINIYY